MNGIVGAENRPRVKCAVVGASGFVGGELVRLLLGHPNVELVVVSTAAPRRLKP